MKKSIIRYEENQQGILSETSLHPRLCKIYQNRKISELAALDYRLTRLLALELMQDADVAAELLFDAILANERILIIGDYDVDGATSASLAILALREFGAKDVDFLVPNRFDFGYGLSPAIVEFAVRTKNPDMIITVDNGISSVDGVACAKKFGIKVIVTDHHLPGEELPAADVIVNPNLKSNPFPSKALAGVGVIFYLMMALRRYALQQGYCTAESAPKLAKYLDLVALGTVADVVPLDTNNRILVENGLRRIRKGQTRPGILSLLSLGKREYQQVVASDLGFAVGPRINAAGRLDDISVGIHCLLAESMDEANTYARVLDDVNRDRKLIEAQMKQEAEAEISNFCPQEFEQQKSVVLYRPDWHQGVIGILASRIKEKVAKPTIIFAATDDNELKGSARSVEGLNIRDCLDRVDKLKPGLMSKFGGHAMAAGLSIKNSDLESFTSAFELACQEDLQDTEAAFVVLSDGSLECEQLSLSFANEIRFAGPWGQCFPEPVFDDEFIVVNKRLLGEQHIKLVLAHPSAPQALIDAIWFNVGATTFQRLPDRLHLAYRLDINAFRGQRSLQLMIETAQIDE